MEVIEQQPLVIVGHRGAAGLEPENTIPSFLKALDLGCRALELDVHGLSGSKLDLAVIHDAQLERTTNLQGPVSDRSKAELARAVPPVPTLDDVITALLSWCEAHGVPAHSLILNIELKAIGTAERVHTMIQQRPELSYLVSSFKHGELRSYRKLDEQTAVAPLFGKWNPDAISIARELNAVSINLNKRLVTRPRVQAILEAGFKIWVYTVNARRSAQRLHKMGVTGIFTDRPDLMLR